jgi:ubiquinone/menaquinone biosynthesis C-methylase UbiE
LAVNVNKTSSRYPFGSVARRYDRWYETGEGQKYDRLEKDALLTLLEGKDGGRKDGGRLLEVGSGTGWWSRFFSELGFAVTGIDLSPEMVAVARAKRIPAAHFAVANAHALPFADGTFDACAAITAIEFTRHPEAVIDEMVRCTRRPGGTLYLGLLNTVARVNRRRAAKEGSLYAQARFFTVEEICALLARYGRVRTRVAASPLAVKLPLPLGRGLDGLAARLGLKSGAFIAVRVDL